MELLMKKVAGYFIEEFEVEVEVEAAEFIVGAVLMSRGWVPDLVM